MGRDVEDKGTSPSLTGSEAQDTHYTWGLQQQMHDLDCSRGDSEGELTMTGRKETCKPSRLSMVVVGVVRCIERLLIACASMSLDSCYSAR
jgi:hypothetical protein